MDIYFDNIHGPGRKINVDATCAQPQDMFENIFAMTGEISGNPKRKIVARFGHGSTILAMLRRLRLFLDSVPPLASSSILIGSVPQLKMDRICTSK